MRPFADLIINNLIIIVITLFGSLYLLEYLGVIGNKNKKTSPEPEQTQKNVTTGKSLGELKNENDGKNHKSGGKGGKGSKN